LDEIRAEDNKIMEEMDIARTSSLVDGDSAFMDSVQGGRDNNSELRAKDKSFSSSILKPTSSKRHISASTINEKHVGFIGNSCMIGRKQQRDTTGSSLDSKRPIQTSMSGSSIKSSCGMTKNGGISVTWSDRYNEDLEHKRNNASTFPVPHKSIDNRNISSMQKKYAVCGRDSLQNNSHERREKLISEMVTDRVLGMRMESEIISDSIPRDNKKYMEKGSKSQPFYTGGRPHEGRFETSPQGQYDESLSKSHSQKCHLSKIVDPSSSSSLNPLNVSELTELSYNQFEANRNAMTMTNTERSQRAVTRSSSKRMHTDDDKQDDWQASAIGYYRRVNPTSHQNDKVATSPQRNRCTKNIKSSSSVDGPSMNTNENFDENFWKEDADDLNTEAFETYNSSENDSLFSDILSTPDIYSKNSFVECKQFQTNNSRPKHDCEGQLSRAELSRYTNTSRYTRAGESSRYSRNLNSGSNARTTYLQGDDFVCF